MNSRENPYSIGALNRSITQVLESADALNDIYVIGEASNVKYHTNGYLYFSLKDGKDVISGIVFKWDLYKALSFELKNGDKILVRGNVKYSTFNGSCQLQAMKIEKAGAGDLNAQFEELKRRLGEMGMFDEMYKKPIPKYVTSIGVVTSPTGAAVWDIVRVSRQRYSGVRIVVYPALVQGENAPPSIVKGIEVLDQMGLDVLIVGRGGGSKEDLWCFNDEQVARAIFNANTPIISAVGHEIDTSISDFVADKSAPTPTAAAELAVFDARELKSRLSVQSSRLKNQMEKRIALIRLRLSGDENSLRLLSPQSQLLAKVNHLADISDRMTRAINNSLARQQVGLNSIRERFRYVSPRHIYDKRVEKVMALARRLDAISPVKRLASGFSYITDDAGKNVRSASDVEVGSMVTVFMNEGRIRAEVKEKYDGRE